MPTPMVITMSASRIRRLEACPRREWWHTEGARDGWAPSADARTREAWCRRCATSLPAVLGQGIHEVAAMIARAYRDGRRPPTYHACRAHVRGRLATLWRARDVDAFRRNPRRDGMLLERLDGGDVPPDVVDGIRIRLPALVRRLIAHPVWEQVRDCGRGDIVLCDALDAMLVEMDDAMVKVYAAPDLCLITRSALHVPEMGLPIPAGSPMLVDWKTGHVGDWLLQLSIYAWYVRDHLRIPPGPLGYVGRVGDLAGSDQEPLGGQIVMIGDAEIARGQAVVERAVRQVMAWSGPDGRLVRERMPMIESSCRYCAMRPLCGAPDMRGLRPENGPTSPFPSDGRPRVQGTAGVR